jgi:hypothetical protein
MSHLSPLPAIATTVRSRKTHQYFWKKDFSGTSPSAGASLPSGPMIVGLRELSFGTGPGVGVMSSTWTFAESSAAGAGWALDFDFAFELDFVFDFDFDFEGRRRGKATAADTDALKTVPSFGERCREIVCVRELLKVASEVRVELPFGKRIRRSLEDVGEGVVDCASTAGGVQDDKDDLRVLGS